MPWGVGKFFRARAPRALCGPVTTLLWAGSIQCPLPATALGREDARTSTGVQTRLTLGRSSRWLSARGNVRRARQEAPGEPEGALHRYGRWAREVGDNQSDKAFVCWAGSLDVNARHVQEAGRDMRERCEGGSKGGRQPPTWRPAPSCSTQLQTRERRARNPSLPTFQIDHRPPDGGS